MGLHEAVDEVPPVGGTCRRGWDEPPEHRLARIAANFAAIVSCIDDCKPEQVLASLLQETEAFCSWAAADSAGELKRLLSNLTKPLQTWRQVWSRLGAQREFRLAVAREAAMWAKRLEQMAKHPPAIDAGRSPRT